MDPKLRELIDTKKLYKGLMPEIAALLPADDAGLDALIAEVVARHQSHAFLYLMLAALTDGRPVDSRHLVGGTALFGHTDWLSCISWKLEGEVAEHLVEAVHSTVMSRELHAAAMLIAAAWSLKFREGKLPARLIGLARVTARSCGENPFQVSCLWAMAEMLKEEDLAAVLRAEHPDTDTKQYNRIAVAFGATILSACHQQVTELIPEKPDNFIGRGPHVRRAVARVGRNDPCPCGSGQKYKRCCAAKDQERLRHSSHVEGKTLAEVRAEPEAHLTETRLLNMSAHAVARIDVTKLPPKLSTAYLMALEKGLLVDEIGTAFETFGCETEELEKGWDHLIQTVGMQQRADIARRMLKVRYKDGPVPDTLCFRVRLLLAREDPERYLQLIESQAATALTATDDNVRMEFAYSLLVSSHPALGIHCARSQIPLIGKKLASKLLHLVEVARDKQNLPPEEPFGEILEKRFAEETASGGKEAEALRKAQQKLEAKAAEMNQMKEAMEKLRREIRLQEKKTPAAATTEGPVEPQELRDLREKVRHLKSAMTAGNNERASYRRELGQAYAELQALRERQTTAAPVPAAEAADAEDALLLPGEVEGNQPPRPIEFPRRFHDTLQHLPRQIGRAALIHLGRIAAGDPTAFSGAIRLRAAPDVMRVRVGMDHRMLFRLLPESVQLVDLINRRDLEKCIATL